MNRRDPVTLRPRPKQAKTQLFLRFGLDREREYYEIAMNAISIVLTALLAIPAGGWSQQDGQSPPAETPAELTPFELQVKQAEEEYHRRGMEEIQRVLREGTPAQRAALLGPRRAQHTAAMFTHIRIYPVDVDEFVERLQWDDDRVRAIRVFYLDYCKGLDVVEQPLREWFVRALEAKDVHQAMQRVNHDVEREERREVNEMSCCTCCDCMNRRLSNSTSSSGTVTHWSGKASRRTSSTRCTCCGLQCC